MNDSPLFSIIIPTFNRADKISRCLNSLVAQTYKNFEVLVCDDGSTDNTAEVVSPYKTLLQISYFWNTNWGGPARPRNIGIRKAKGEWICFLDSDDWWKAEKLECIAKAINADTDVIYHNLEIKSDKNPFYSFRNLSSVALTSPIFDDLIKKGNVIPNSGSAVRKELLVKVNGLSEDRNLIAAEDFDLWLRLAKLTNNFISLNQFLGYYYLGGGSISSRQKDIQFLIKLQDLYLYPKNKLIKSNPGWWEYKIGMAYFFCKSPFSNSKHLFAALQKNISFFNKLKACLAILIWKFRLT